MNSDRCTGLENRPLESDSLLDRVISLALHHRLVVLFFALALLVYGGWIGSKLAVDVFPDLNRPVVTVMTEANGMAPEEVETLVTLPLETQLNGLSGVERVRSVSGVGLSIVYIEFQWGTPILQNRQLVAERLALTAERLPRGVVPVMAPVASIMGEVQLLGLYSKANISGQDLRTFADWVLRPRLLSVPGISQVVVIGGGVKQYQILISAEKLQRYQLTLEDLEVNLKSLGRNTTGGYLDQGGREFLIRNIGSVRSEDDIKQSVVGMRFGRPVRVADVANVQVGAQVKRGDASVNGHPAVVLSIQKQPGANTLEIEKNIDVVLDQIESTLPAGSVLERGLFKQSVFIRSAINNVTEALRDGAILVAIVLFVFLLNLRTTAITLIAIPLSFVLTAIIFKLFNLGINTMTLGGLAIAIGELVDDAIVDVENVFRRLQQNQLLPVAERQPVIRVVYQASSEVRNAIVYATAIVVLVFLPLFFLGGIEGRFFIPLGIAYVVSLLASLVVSLTVTPVLCSLWLKNLTAKQHRESPVVTYLKSWHRRALDWALLRPRVVIVFSLILLGVSVILLSTMGREFLPKFNESSATITVLAEPGISLEQSDALGRQAEEIILKTPEVAIVSRRTGRAELDEHAEGVHYSEVDVVFKEPHDVQPVRKREVVLEDIRQQLNTLKNVYINIGQPISHRLDHLLSGVRAQIAIKVFGPELKELREKAHAILSAISGTQGLVDLQIEQQVLIPQIKIQLMRDAAARFGLSNGRLIESLETAFKGQNVAQVIDHQRLFNVFMRLDEASRRDQETFKNTPVRMMPDGTKVVLGDVADIYESTGPNAIMRENVQRRIVVQANVLNRDLQSVVTELQSKVAQASDKIKLGDGYYIDWAGQFKSQQQSTQTMIFLGLLSVIGIFIILYINFSSAFIAVQIMLNIPMALIGSVVAVYVVDRTVSMATLVAFVTLCGIASRNGIMLISHYLHLMQHEGEQFTKDMVIRGSLERLVPVMMTVLTAILGLTPLLFAAGQPGKEILHPLAVVIVGGLISSTLLDLIVTPTVFYNYGRTSALRSIQHKEVRDL